jgi:hypothetical protein
MENTSLADLQFAREDIQLQQAALKKLQNLNSENNILERMLSMEQLVQSYFSKSLAYVWVSWDCDEHNGMGVQEMLIICWTLGSYKISIPGTVTT